MNDRGIAGDVPAVDKPSVYIDVIDGVPKVVYRASALCSCTNILLFFRQGGDGTAPPDWMQQRYDAGHDHEPLILGKIERKFGFRPYGFQMDVEIPVGSHAMIRGHIDALEPAGSQALITHLEGVELPKPTSVQDLPGAIVFGNTPLVVDAKALSMDSFDKWIKHGFEAFPYYAWQQSIYAYGLQAGGVVMAVKNKNTDDLITDFYPVSSPHLTPMASVFSRVLEIENLYASNAELAFPCVEPNYPCPIWFLHPTDETKVEISDKETQERIGLVAHRRDQAKEQVALLAEEITGYETEITDLVGGKVAKAKTNYGTVSTYHSTSSHPDWDAIAEALDVTSAEAREKFNKKTESRKLSIRLTKPKSKRETPS